MGRVNNTIFILSSSVLAEHQHVLGVIHLDLEEFEKAQKNFQGSFETYKAVYEDVNHKATKQTHLGTVMAAKMAGNLHNAKEILETAEESLLGNTVFLELYTSNIH